MMTEQQIDTACDAMRTAQATHAKCLQWSHTAGRMMPIVSDEELSAKYIAALVAEQAFYLACGDTESAKQIGYQIEDANA